MVGKSIAIAFLATVALVPVAIVVYWHHLGAAWIAGYVVGMITVPLVGIGALRAASELFEDDKAFVAFVIFGFTAVAISLAAAALGSAQ